jgi:hypothetical protein
MTYRVGNHQPQNVYRDDRYIGVMFDPETAALVVEALNAAQGPALLRLNPPDLTPEQLDEFRSAFRGLLADSCTCPLPFGANPACPVHQGRRARGPKPPPLGEGCICDGSGRTCPRHGAVI